MPVEAVVFTVSVENQADIEEWMANVAAARDVMEAAYRSLLDVCQNRPLVQLTLHRSDPS